MMEKENRPFRKADVKASLTRIKNWSNEYFQRPGATNEYDPVDHLKFRNSRVNGSPYQEDRVLARAEEAAMQELLPANPKITKKGDTPIAGEEIAEEQHISGSTKWRFDDKNDRMQEVRRFAVAPEGDLDKTEVIELYSAPVSPIIKENEFGRHLNTEDAELSGGEKLLNTLGDKDILLGWVPFQDRNDQPIPQNEE